MKRELPRHSLFLLSSIEVRRFNWASAEQMEALLLLRKIPFPIQSILTIILKEAITV